MRAFIVRILFGRGQFTWEDTITTFSLLGVFSFAMIAQSLSPLLVRAFYAKQNTVIPVIINVVSILLITLLSDLVLIYFPFLKCLF
jgi:putative peptidoglycan lipid II flippase